MTNKIINSKKAPSAIGPYSHSVLVDKTLYVSGQLGVDPITSELKNTIEEQVTQAFTNLGEILKEAAMSYGNITKTTIFITDMNDFPIVNNIYGTFFTDNYPARSCVAVSQLPMGGLFEIEVIATV